MSVTSSVSDSESSVHSSPRSTIPEIIESVQNQPSNSLGEHLSVSQAFKHSCYFCGNLGHHAHECSHKVKLCYNCGKPDHRSSECKETKKNTAKQCFYCKVIGHVQSDCPKLKNSDLKKREQHTNKHTNNHNYHHHHTQSQFQLRKQQSAFNLRQNSITPNTSFQHQDQRPHLVPYVSPAYGSFYQPIPTQAYAVPAPAQFTPVHITPFPPGGHNPPMFTTESTYSPPLFTSGPPVYNPPPQAFNHYNQQLRLNSVNQHYGNRLVKLRSYASDMNMNLNLNMRRRPTTNCYTCGADGHDSRHCPLNDT